MHFTNEEIPKQPANVDIWLIRLVPKYCRGQLDVWPLTAKVIVCV